MTGEELRVHVTESPDGISPAWVASARGASCRSQYSANDAVAALIEQLLQTGVITQQEAASHVVAQAHTPSRDERGAGRLLNRQWRRRSHTGG